MAACVGCGRDNPAGARFCAECGTALTAACSHCSADLPPDARFCAFCGRSVGAAVSAPGEPVEMIKLVTVLFADVVGSTAQAELMHPEDTRALMAEFFDAMSEEIRAQGGTVERLIGDAIMADFGVPMAREDDPIRAVRAARRMLDRVERFNRGRDGKSRVSIRIGINTGEVSTGGSFGEQLLVMGDAVNLAARLEQAAPVGGILIGERTANAVRDWFALREIDALEAKGKTEPVSAFAVEAELDDTVDPETFLMPLVGRDVELQKLHREFVGVCEERRPRLVTVIGDPGVGKSRLTREFLGLVHEDAKLMFGRCLPYGNGVTFWPLREIARTEAGLSAAGSGLEERERLAAFVDEVMPSDALSEKELVRDSLFTTVGFQGSSSAVTDPRETYRRLLQGWCLLLTRFAEQRPVVVVIEDLHWADSTMLEVLDDLLRHVKGPLFIVCPTRSELIESHPVWVAGLKNYTTVNLDPLTYEDSCRFMSLLLELDEMPEELTSRILERAEGNPFFLEEILNRLIDEGYFVLQEGRWEPVGDLSAVHIPDNVQAVILARLDLLSVEERRIVQLASVVGRTFWKSVLEELAGGMDLGAMLNTLGRRHLILERSSSSREGDPEYAFKHVLTRDVAYSSVPRKLRGTAHAAVAKWIESTRGPQASQLAELVAHHFAQAYGCLQDDELRRKARVYFVVASRNAALRLARKQAETFGRSAVELSVGAGERVDSLETLADVLYLSGRGDDAWGVYLEALEELQTSAGPDPVAISRICANAAIIPTRNWGSIDLLPDHAQIERILDLGFSTPRHEGGMRERCLLLVAKAFFEADRDRATEAREAADEALDLAERLNDPDLESAALDALAGTYMHPEGLYGDVETITRRRLSLVPRLSALEEVADVQGMAAVAATLIGRYSQAVGFATESSGNGRVVDVGAYMHGLNWRTQARFMSGDWDGAVRDEAEITKMERRSADDLPGPYSARAYATVSLCLILRSSPEADDRIALLRRFRHESDWFRYVSAIPARGLARLGMGEEALGWLDLSRWTYRAQHLEAACDIVGLLEEWDRVPDLVSDARQEASRCGLVALSFFADRLEGQRLLACGEPEDAVSALTRSADGFATAGASWEAGWSALLAAEGLLRTGRGETARPLCAGAAQTFRRLGSVGEADRAASLLQEMPVG